MERMPGFRLRHQRMLRIAGAIAIGVGSWALAFGVVVAAPWDRDAAAPEEFGMPARMVGDSGVYSFDLLQGSWHGPTAVVHADDAVRFAWKEPMEVQRPDAGWTRVDAMAQEEAGFWGTGGDAPGVVTSPLAPGPPGEGTRLTFEPGALSASGAAEAGTFNTTREEHDPRPGTHTVHETRTGSFVGWARPQASNYTGWQQGAFCGLVHPLQGRPTVLGGGVRLFERCHLAHDFVEEGTFVAQASERIHSVACVRFESGSQPQRRFRVWLCEDSPYPARIEIDYLGESRIGRFTLRTWTRGDRPLATPLEVAGPGELPTLAPSQLWGPDDARTTVAFSLHEALDAARNDSNPMFRDFLAAHPESFLRTASFREDIVDHVTTWSWSLRMQGIDGDVHAEVSRRPDGGTTVGSMRTTTVHLAPDLFAQAPLPATLPAVASLAETWSHFRPADFPADRPNHWEIRMAYPSGGCLDVLDADDLTASWYHHCPLQRYISIGYERTTWTSRNGAPPEADGTKETIDGSVQVGFDGVVRAASFFVARADHAPGALMANPPDTPPYATMALHAADFGLPPPFLWTGAMGALLAACYALLPALRRSAAFVLFTRLDRPRVLAHPVRHRILSLLEVEPGVHFLELHRRLGLPRSTLEHHLRRLVAAGLVDQSIANGYACYFPSGRVDRRVRAAVPHLKSATAQQLLSAIAREPGIAGVDAASRVGVDPSAITYHAHRLERLGLVDARRDGRHVRLFATDLASAALALSSNL